MSYLVNNGIHTLTGAIAAGNRGVPDSEQGLSLKIRLYIRLFPLTNSYSTNKSEKSLYLMRTIPLSISRQHANKLNEYYIIY